MAATAIIEKKGTKTIARGKSLKGTVKSTNGVVHAYVTQEKYYEEYRNREDGFKYEWLDGKIEKTPKGMHDAQSHIAENLTMLFYTLKIAGRISGTFQTEMDTFVEGRRIRVPDMCYLNPQQAYDAVNGGHPIADFMIEVVSTHDKIEDYETKLNDYFTAGVKIVWWIFPKQEAVYVIANDGQALICRGEMICSASPVLPDFQLTTNAVFQKPAKP
jgi:Uma2 family endonuclease